MAQTCEDVVGFPPEPNLALHPSHLVLAVALKCNTIEVHLTASVLPLLILSSSSPAWVSHLPEGVAASLGTAVKLLLPVLLTLLSRHLMSNGISNSKNLGFSKVLRLFKSPSCTSFSAPPGSPASPAGQCWAGRRNTASRPPSPSCSSYPARP